MKQLILLLSAIACFNLLFSQEVHQIMPKPTDQRIYDIEFFDIARGIMVGANGTILLTDDGGDNWEAINTEITEGITEAELIDRGNCIIRTSNYLYKTSDYGQSWELLFEVPDTATFSKIDMVDRVYGFAVCKNRTSGASILVVTEDGGQSWHVKEMKGFRYGKDRIYDIAFDHPQRGMMIGYHYYESVGFGDDELLRSLNGGNSIEWVTYSTEELKTYASVEKAGDGVFYFGGYEMRSKKEDDLLIDNELSKPEGYYEYYAECFKAVNYGDEFVILLEPYSRKLMVLTKNIEVLNDSIFYMGGTAAYHEDPLWDYYCVCSRDGGKTWHWPRYDFPIGVGDPDASAIAIRPDGKMFGCQSGSNNGFVETFVTMEDGYYFDPYKEYYYGNYVDMCFVEGGVSFLGEMNMNRCDDNLNNWSHSDHNPVHSMKFLRYCDSKNGIVQLIKWGQGSKNNLIYWTDNGGKSWNFVDPKTPKIFHPTSVSYPQVDRLYMFDAALSKPQNKALMFSDDRGQSFRQIELPEDRDSLRRVHFTKSAGYIFGGLSDGRGGYYKCTDDSYSWQFIDLGIKKIMGTYPINDSLVFVRHGRILQALDLKIDELLDIQITETGDHTIRDVLIDIRGNYCFLATSAEGTYFYFGPDLNVLKSSGPYPPMRGLTLDPDGQHIWAFGNNGRLYYLGDGMPVGVDPIGSPGPSPFKIYGNPISHNLEFSVKLDFQGEALLQVMDMNGKLVL